MFLSETFLREYAGVLPAFGPVGEVTYRRTYARPLESCPAWEQELATKFGVENAEDWFLTVARVVEGVYKHQQQHCQQMGLPWSHVKAEVSARKMYSLIFNFKFLPPGRGLWAMGTPYVEKNGSACLYNCSFVSTEDIDRDFADPFTYLMDMSMLGVGVGGDTRGAGKVTIRLPIVGAPVVVEDSREGWIYLIRRILGAYGGQMMLPDSIDYSQLRPAGAPIKGFGGTSSGPEPLKQLVADIRNILAPLIGQPITSRAIVDLFNAIGRCVVSGNVRRSAEIMFGEPDDADFLRLKDYEYSGNEYRQGWGWASNNSIFAKEGMNYARAAMHTAHQGEPGYLWLDNARAYGRMADPPNWDDAKVGGCNPCGEISLESRELCNIVETFPSRHETLAEYLQTLKYAYLYSKTVTLIPTHDERTNAVMMRNRRIGTSQTGIVESTVKHGRRQHLEWCEAGYQRIKELDRRYSDWLCVPRSIKVTTVKPSGTVSLLPGVTPGIHFPHSEYYYRVIRFATNSPMVEALRKAGYACYDLALSGEANTTGVYFPVKEANFDRAKSEVSMWEQLELAAQMQAHWADNQVSATVTFSAKEAPEIKRALELYEGRLKSISFLPLADHGYKHAPYQEISQEEYEAAIARVGAVHTDAAAEAGPEGCDSDKCEVKF